MPTPTNDQQTPGEVVGRFVESLRSIGAPVLRYLRPPLSEDELRSRFDAAPYVDADLVDEWVLAWWSWHEGVDTAAARADRYTAVDRVMPGSPLLTGVFDICSQFDGYRQMLTQDFDPDEVATMEASLTSGPFIPIAWEGSGLTAFRRVEAGREWEIWDWVSGLEWQRKDRPDNSSFGSILTRFCDVAEQGGFEISKHGGVKGRGRKEHYWQYPWQD
jgi:hypothetical protein